MLLVNIWILKWDIYWRESEEDLIVEEVIYFVFELLEQINVLLFDILAIFFGK